VRDPWTVLELDPAADEVTIRKRYLELVRRYPPDREPERFREVREAYGLLRDPVKRIEAQLFDMRSDEQLDEIVDDLRQRMRDSRIPTDALLRLADAT